MTCTIVTAGELGTTVAGGVRRDLSEGSSLLSPGGMPSLDSTTILGPEGYS